VVGRDLVGVEGSTVDAGGGMDGKEGMEVVMQSIETENGGWEVDT